LVADISVWQAKDLEPASCQMGGSFGILLDSYWIHVNSSVNFQNQSMFCAIEIHDESVDHLLPSELHSQHTPVA